MRLAFRQRILLILICLGAVPTAVAIFGWALTVRSTTPAAGALRAMEDVGASGRVLIQTLDSTRLTPVERRALADHADKLNSALGRFQRVDAFGRYYYAGLGLVVLLVGAAFLYASVRVGGHLSRQLSRPIEELIGWTGAHPPDGGAAARPAPARRARVRGPAHGAPRDGHRARAGPRARDRGRAAPRLSGDGPAGGARDAEPAHADPPRRGAAGALRRGAAARGHRGARRGVGPAGAAGARVHRVRAPARGAGRAGRPRRAADRSRPHERAAHDAGVARARPRPSHPAGPLRSRCRRAFGNIIRNAVEAMRGPGPRSSCRPGRRTAGCGSRSATTAPASRPIWPAGCSIPT